MQHPTGPNAACFPHRPGAAPRTARLALAGTVTLLLGGCFIGVKPVHKEVLSLAPVATAVVVPSPAAAAASQAQAREARVAAAAAEQAARTPPPPVFIDNLPNQIYFDNDAYLVGPQFQGLLSQHAANLKADRRLRLQIRAYTDAKGGVDYNRALAQMRAATVAKELGNLGVDRAQLEMLPRAADRPAPGAMASDARSRRVELVYQR